MIFTKESWDDYKESVKQKFPDGVRHMMREPTFEGYMDFCFQDTNEPTLDERTKEALSGSPK